jgi:hypothetical protein
VIEDNSIHKLYPPGDDKWDSSVVYIVTYPKGESSFNFFVDLFGLVSN